MTPARRAAIYRSLRRRKYADGRNRRGNFVAGDTYAYSSVIAAGCKTVAAAGFPLQHVAHGRAGYADVWALCRRRPDGGCALPIYMTSWFCFACISLGLIRLFMARGDY